MTYAGKEVNEIKPIRTGFNLDRGAPPVQPVPNCQYSGIGVIAYTPSSYSHASFIIAFLKRLNLCLQAVH